MGPVYSMVMTDASPAMAAVHNRMPVLLAPGDRERWIAGSADEAIALCRPWSGALTIDRTDQLWKAR